MKNEWLTLVFPSCPGDVVDLCVHMGVWNNVDSWSIAPLLLVIRVVQVFSYFLLNFNKMIVLHFVVFQYVSAFGLLSFSFVITDRQADTQADTQTIAQTDTQTHTQTDTQIDTQTHTRRHTHADIHSDRVQRSIKQVPFLQQDHILAKQKHLKTETHSKHT